MTDEATPLLEIDNVSKYFGSVIALQDITTKVGAAAVTCVLGDNGGGQVHFDQDLRRGCTSTTRGEFRVQGEPVRFASPREALDRGIATVYQDLAVVRLMPVWRNFFLGSEIRRGEGPVRPPRHRGDAQDHQGGTAGHGDRPARRRPADRHPLRR